MKCVQCGIDLKQSFKFCPECGQKLDESGGKSPGKPSLQEEQDPQDPPLTSGSSSEQLPCDNVVKKCDPNQEKDANAGTSESEGSAVVVDALQHHAGLSSQTPNQEDTTENPDATSQSAQSSYPHENIRDTSSFQSQFRASAEPPDSQVLPGKSESDYPSQPVSSCDALSQIPVEPGNEENIEKNVGTFPPETEQSPSTDSVPASSSNNDVQPGKSPPVQLVMDQNKVKSHSIVNETFIEGNMLQITSSTPEAMPVPGTCKTQEEPGLKDSSHEGLENTKTINLTVEASVLPQPSTNQTAESTTEEGNVLQNTNGQSDKSNSSNRKLFEPCSGEEIHGKPKNGCDENKQQTKRNEGQEEKKEIKGQKQNTREGTEAPKPASSTEKPDRKNAASDQNKDSSLPSKDKKDRQNQASNPQQETKEISVFFHAILSKDFKLDPVNDFVTVRSGVLSGNWNQDLMKMEISKNFEEHGFIVHGKMQVSKKYVGKSIPYKYVVHKQGKNSCDYEYIYKEHGKHIVNRCFLIREHLLTQQGEWHQYDDIICAKPSDGMMDKMKHFFVSTKPDLVNGRNIAGYKMLETIFEILHEWSGVNVRNFFAQLQQFFTTYSKPFVYEDKPKPWTSLQYGEEEVKNLLLSFMQDKISMLLNVVYNPLCLKEAIILLMVYKKFSLKMDTDLTHKFGWLLRLPNLSEEEFCRYWADFLQPLSKESVAPSVRAFCQAAINCRSVNWILTIPLLHLLEGESKPFKPNQLPFKQEFNVWAGLKGIQMNDLHRADSQHTRQL